jgi:hypothetical protein
MKKSVFCTVIAMLLGSSAAQALSIDITEMQHYDADGVIVPQYNYLLVTTTSFDSNLNGSSGSPFFGPDIPRASQAAWDDTVTGVSANWSGTSASGPFSYDYTLKAGEVAVGIFLQWFDRFPAVAVLQIFDCDGSGVCTGVTSDSDPGHPGGPHAVPGTAVNNNGSIYDDQHITFSGLAVAPVPVPAAVWLFCSGLVGLAGFSGRKRKIQN